MMGGGWMCVLVAASLAPSGLSVPLRQAAETLCATQENFVRIAAQESCIKYFQCYSGRAYLMQCPDYTWYNDSEQICDDREPPQGCEFATSPTPPPPPPEEPEEEPEEPIEEPEEPIEEPEEPIEEPEEPAGDPEEPIEEPEEPAGEPDEPVEEAEEPVAEPEEPIEEPEEPAGEPEEPIEEPKESTEDPIEGPELPIGEPAGDPEEPGDANEQEEDVDNQEANEEEQDIGETEEGSGDFPNQDSITEPNENVFPDVEVGSGDDTVRAFIMRRLGRSEEENITDDFHSISFEASGENSQSHGFDLEMDELFQSEITGLPEEDLFEIPSIDPVFVIPDSEANYK